MKSQEKIVIAIYMRVSTQRQQTEAQRAGIEAWIKKNKYPEAKLIWFEDKATGATLERPAFKRLLAAVKKGSIQKIITFEISRLSRDFVDTLTLMRTLSEHSVELEIPDRGVVRFQDSLEKFMVAAKALVAGQERELIGRRIREGLKAAKARGVKLGARKGSRHRLGKTKTHDPEFIQRLKRLSEKLSVREIAGEIGVSAATVSRLLRKYS